MLILVIHVLFWKSADPQNWSIFRKDNQWIFGEVLACLGAFPNFSDLSKSWIYGYLSNTNPIFFWINWYPCLNPVLVSCFEIPIHTNTHQFIPIHTNTSFSKLDISIISPFLSPWLVHHVQILGPKMGFLALGCLVKPSKSNTSCVIQRGQKRHFSLDCCSQVSTQKVKTISVVFRVRDFFGGGEQLPMACRFQLSFWRALGNYFARTGWLREVLGGL